MDTSEAVRDREVARYQANAKLFPNAWLFLLSTPLRQSRMPPGLLSAEAIRAELLGFGARYKGYAFAPDVFGWGPSREQRESVDALIDSVKTATYGQLWAFYRDQWGMEADPFYRLQREKNAEYAKMLVDYAQRSWPRLGLRLFKKRPAVRSQRALPAGRIRLALPVGGVCAPTADD
ncbi:hypothetical protein [Mycobacteroides chelonae]|nr:hypothetical protein [Mycobacteroides chelonae]